MGATCEVILEVGCGRMLDAGSPVHSQANRIIGVDISSITCKPALATQGLQSSRSRKETWKPPSQTTV
jgi:predicted TPR repeat methyltransferase